MKKEINDCHNTKPYSQTTKSSQQNPLLSKSSNLLELLKARKGQNINIDISMLSNKGSLTNLIEKAKKYQAPPISTLDKKSPKYIAKEPTNENLEQNEDKKYLDKKQNLKGHSQIEILEKLSKRKFEKNINNDDNINIEEISEETNEKTSNKNLNNEDLSQKNVLNYKLFHYLIYF